MPHPRSAIALVFLVTACTTWAPITTPVPDPGRVDRGPFRIVGTDSFTRVGEYLTADSQMVRYSRKDGDRDSIPRPSVARIEARKFNPAGTGVLLGVIVIFTLAMRGMMDGMFVGGGTGGIY
jgi:hypothetical protein